MEIRAIKTSEDYEWALKEIEKLMDAEPETEEGDRLDVLATLVDAYEAIHFPIDEPDPVSAVKFRMEQQGLKPKDLIPFIGQRSHVYEVLSGKRPFSLKMASKLHKHLNIPAKIFLRELA